MGASLKNLWAILKGNSNKQIPTVKSLEEKAIDETNWHLVPIFNFLKRYHHLGAEVTLEAVGTQIAVLERMQYGKNL